MNRALVFATFLFSASATADAIPDYVRQNAPVFVSRRDQIAHPETDRILAVGYSITPGPDGVATVRYTTFFSDEDSQSTVAGTDYQMARYGRRLDIEWTYQVRIDPRTGRGFDRRYQCALVVGIGHRNCVFRGHFFQNSDRPVLYNIARHNVFADRPKLPYGTAHGRLTVIDPAFEIPYPKSRDLIPVENPEFLRTSDEELLREHKLSRPSTEYAFLRVRGTLGGRPHLAIVGPNGKIYRNGTLPKDALHEMGLDLWGKESVVAIALPDPVRFALKSGLGSFRLGLVAPRGFSAPFARIRLEDVGLYLVDRNAEGHYETTDLSPRIRCATPSDLNTCSVN